MQDKEGWTALIHAAWNGKKKVVTRLLKAGVDPNEQNGKALIAAILKSHPKVVKALVAGGIDANTRDIDGIPALMLIAASETASRLEMARYLLDTGADPHIGAFGKTPLMIARQNRDNDLIDLLQLSQQ